MANTNTGKFTYVQLRVMYDNLSEILANEKLDPAVEDCVRFKLNAINRQMVEFKHIEKMCDFVEALWTLYFDGYSKLPFATETNEVDSIWGQRENLQKLVDSMNWVAKCVNNRNGCFVHGDTVYSDNVDIGETIHGIYEELKWLRKNKTVEIAEKIDLSKWTGR